MFIKTADGYKPMNVNAIEAPEDPGPPDMASYQSHGFQSYLGWLRNDRSFKGDIEDDLPFADHEVEEFKAMGWL